MNIIASLLCAASLVAIAIPARAEMVRSRDGKTVSFIQRGHPRIDYANARPLTLPMSKKPLPSHVDMVVAAAKARYGRAPALFPGRDGGGKTTPVEIPPSRYVPPNTRGRFTVQEYGSSGQPFMTSRVPFPGQAVFRKSGKLFFLLQNGFPTVCSASLVKPGIVLTAAHCVYDFGNNFYSGWQYIPAYKRGKAPFGLWTGAQAFVVQAYADGSDSCAVEGVICADDVAAIALNPAPDGSYPGAQTGWFGYMVDGYSFSGGQAQITQLGYPVGLDNGEIMQRTDSRGVTTPSLANNTLIGSLMGGGSSGGPWVVNFGAPARLRKGAVDGTAPDPNILVGVTSWGYSDTSSSGPMQQGASPFTSDNVEVLVNAACAAYPGAC